MVGRGKRSARTRNERGDIGIEEKSIKKKKLVLMGD